MLPNRDAKDIKPVDSVQETPIAADHSWYNSLLTQLLVPLFGFRYFFEAVEDINPKNVFKKATPEAEPLNAAWRNPSAGRYTSYNFVAHSMGTLFGAIFAKYSLSTLKDLKSMYAESVGYELGKKTEDVTMHDIFIKSDNEALKVTRKAYAERTMARGATVGTFFVPWHKFRAFAEVKPKYGANAKVGVGAIAAQIYAEGFLREPSFFDAEQKMISKKINHKDVYRYSAIEPEELQTLLMLQRRHERKHYEEPPAASVEGQHDIELTTRMADLINQTYHNKPQTEQAHFTIGKLNFLIGFGMLEKYPENLAYVELANKSRDMSEVKEVAESIKHGESSEKAFAKFDVSVQKAPETQHSEISESVPQKSFADKIHRKTHEISALQSDAIEARTHKDYAEQSASSSHIAP